jgi:type VI secretion system secreted protein Hcp
MPGNKSARAALNVFRSLGARRGPLAAKGTSGSVTRPTILGRFGNEVVAMVRRVLGSRLAVALFAVMLTAAVVGGVSYAVTPSGSGSDTFFACSSVAGVVRSSTIRVNQAPATCPTGDTVRSWNAQGQTGAQGPVGQASVVALPPSLSCPLPSASNIDTATGVATFLDIPSIPGESTDPTHQGQIDVLSWSFDTTGSASTAGAGSCGSVAAGQTSFGELHITKFIDKATPKLFAAVANGTDLSTIVVRVSKQGNDYMVFSLEHAIATSQSMLGGHGGPIPMESVSFAGTALTVTHIPQNANGTTGPPESSCWNVKTKSSCSN